MLNILVGFRLLCRGSALRYDEFMQCKPGGVGDINEYPATERNRGGLSILQQEFEITNRVCVGIEIRS